ncbi:MAG: ABC transporter permease subunit [Sulfobacillus sp.]
MHAEWHRGIRSWRFWVTVALTVFIFLFAIAQYATPWVPTTPTEIPREHNFYTVTLAFLGGYLTALWPVFLPVIAALPAGDSLAVDRRRGMDALAITRVGWAHYLWGKLIGNALLAVVAVAVAIGMAAAVAVVMYPVALPKFLGWTFNMALPYKVKISGVFGDAYPPAFLPHFFWAAPGLYLILAVLVALWATTAVSGLSVAASVWVRQPVLTLAAPIVLFLAGDVVAQGALLHSRLIPSVYAGAYLWWVPPLPSWAALGLYWAVPAVAIALVLGWVVVRRREWPQRSMGR